MTRSGLMRPMKISRILAYQVDLPLREGRYNWSGGKSVGVFDSTIVQVETDGGITGYGEACPLGPVYLPSYAGGVRAGLAELSPHLIGADPTALGVLNRLMDSRLKGHPYVKSRGRHGLLGHSGQKRRAACGCSDGRRRWRTQLHYTGRFPVKRRKRWRAVSRNIARKVIRHFQLKVGK